MVNGEACPLCGNGAVDIFNIPYPLFEHREFKSISDGPFFLGQCRECKVIFRNDSDDILAKIDDRYRSNEYVTRRESLHTVFAEEFGGLKTMPFLQAELLAPYIPDRDAAILDIGCFYGGLLRELSTRYDDADLCGFDVSEETRARFPEGKNFRFVSGSLEDVTGSFDLVVLSHSIQYIRRLGELFGHMDRLLKPGGALFVQVPDLDQRPTSLLLGDLHFYFTPAALENMFGTFSFSCSFLDNHWFPRDLLAAGKPGQADKRRELQADDSVGCALTHLDAMREKLESLSRDSRIGVLGTTIDAAFIDSVLDGGVAFFVEENEKKTGGRFHGKPILSPDEVAASDRVLLPMGEMAETVSARLSREYEGQYVCV